MHPYIARRLVELSEKWEDHKQRTTEENIGDAKEGKADWRKGRLERLVGT
jgi:hypothetical protein